MELSVTAAGDGAVVRVPGPRLDAAVAPDFKRRLVEIIDRGHQSILLDLSAVEFVDSSGLGALVGGYKHLGARGRFELAGLRPAVGKVFALTRMDRVFTIRDSAPPC